MYKRIIFAALAFTLISCETKQINKKKVSVLHLKIGTRHLTNGNYPLALKELLIAERLDNSNPVTYNNLGLAYLVRGKYKTAENHIRHALTLEPKYTEARNNLGRVLIHQSKFLAAEKQLQLAVDDLTYTAPEKSHSNLGIAYFKSKKYKLAHKHLKISLKLRRKHCVTQSYYGRTLYELNALDKAAIAFESAIKICDKSRFYEPRYFSALIAFKLGKKEHAIARFEEVFSLNPEGEFAERSKEMLSLIKRNH